MAAINLARLLTKNSLRALPQLQPDSLRVSQMMVGPSTTHCQLLSRSFSDEKKEESYGTAIRKWFKYNLWKFGFVMDETELRHLLRAQKSTEIIQKFLRDEHLEKSIEIVKLEMTMLEDKNITNFDIYHWLMRASVGAGDVVKAYNVYYKMVETGEDPTDETYDILFSACMDSSCSKKGLQVAEALCKHMTDIGVLPSNDTYHVMIKTFGKLGKIMTSMKLADEMLVTGCIMTHETINCLLIACAYDREYGFRSALLVWRTMRVLDVQPSLSMYHNLLVCLRDCCSGIRDVDEEEVDNPNSFLAAIIKQSADKVETRQTSLLTTDPLAGLLSREMTFMPADLYMPDILAPVMSLGTVVRTGMLDTAAERLSLLGGSEKIIKNIAQDNLQPNAKTFSLLMQSSPRTKIIEDEMMDTLKILALKPDRYFFNCLVEGRLSRKHFEEATSVLMLMHGENLSINEDMIELLALHCTSYHRAETLLTSLEKADAKPTTQVWVEFLKNAHTSLDTIYAAFIITQLQLREIKPNLALSEVLKKIHADVQELISTKKRHPNAIVDEATEEGWQIFCQSYADWQKNEMWLHSLKNLKKLLLRKIGLES